MGSIGLSLADEAKAQSGGADSDNGAGSNVEPWASAE